MSKNKAFVPDHISEEYYQISPEILASFNKFRPPVDLFRFKEDVARLLPLFRKGQRLTAEQAEEIQLLCQQEELFVARSDYPLYSKHICRQLDLVLADRNLKEGEIAEILYDGLIMRLDEFFQQPVQAVFDRLYQDVMVLTEYLNQDKYRIKALLRRLRREHTLASHSVNTGVMGLWLYLKGHDWQYQRRDLDRAALGLFLHDAGMCKIPPFILEKPRISLEERSKIAQHPLIGVKIVQKLGLTFSEMGHAVMEHHERLDGSGYPRKLSAQQISGFGRLVAVADSFCAMIAKRPHAEAMEPAQAAGALAADERRYDSRLTKIVEGAYLTGQF